MHPKGDGKAAPKKPTRNDAREQFLKGTGPQQSGEEMLARCGELEAGLEALKVRHEHFFLGLIRQPPKVEHDILRSAILQLRGGFVRNASVRFRIASVYNRMLAYERLWERTIREMEDGTYRRDVYKARLRRRDAAKDEGVVAAGKELTALTKKIESGAAQSAPADDDAADRTPPEGMPLGALGMEAPAAARTLSPPLGNTAPRAPGPRPPPLRPEGAALSDDKVKAIYDAYVTAKKRCKESTQGITMESLGSTLRKQIPSLLEKHQTKNIEFKVVIKDGKAVLKAVPR